MIALVQPEQGVTLLAHHNISGAGERATVFIPGLGCDARMIWSGLLSRIRASASGSQFSWISLNSRGVGGSSGVPSDFDQLVKDAALILQSFDLDEVRLVGHSFGGAIAVGVAAQLPRLVKNVSLLNTVPRYPLRSREGFLWRASVVRSSGSVSAIFPHVIERSFAAGTEPRVIERFSEMLARNDAGVYANLCEIAASVDARAEFRDLQCPVRLATGVSDHATGATIMRPYADLKGTALKVLPGGHNLPLETPQHLAQFLIAPTEGV